MASTCDQKPIRLLGEGHGFTLYMFEGDLEIIETPTAQPRGYMLGLFTNTLNPVCHIVCKDGFPAEEYRFLKNPQFEDTLDSPLFKSFGYWSFEPLTGDGCQDIKSKQNKSTLPRRFVFLSVEKKTETHFAYQPYLFIKEQEKYEKGRIEQLTGRNPYRLPNSSPSEEETATSERTAIKGQVSSLCHKFEAINKDTSGITPTSKASLNPQVFTSYASITKQGIQSNLSRASQDDYHLQMSTKSMPITSNIGSRQEGLKESGDNSEPVQWYEIQPEDLKSTVAFVQTLADEKKPMNITRDKTTLDMTITFTHHYSDWAIDFPCDFPTGIVKVKQKKYQSASEAYSYSIDGLGSMEKFKAKLQSTLTGQCTGCRTFSTTRYYHR